MDKEKILKLFNKIYNIEMEENRKYKIIDKIIMFDKYIELSPISLLNVIETFVNIEKLGFIDKINENLFALLKNIICKNKDGKVREDDGLYVLDYINYLVIPYNVIKCENEYDLPKFLGEFEILVSYIEDDDSFLDMEKLRNYNEKLYNIIIFRISWIMKNINNDIFKNSNLKDMIIIETTLAHLMTIFYFSFDEYGQNIDILKNSYDVVLENYDRLKEYCKEKNIYNDLLSNNMVSNDNALVEFEFCKEILDGLMEKNKKKVKK